MKTTLLALCVGALAVLATIAGLVVLYQYRLRHARPDFDRVGGTELVLEVAEGEKDPRLDELCRVLAKRLDRYEDAGVVVEPEGKRRVAVRVPNGHRHDAIVEEVKQSAWRT